MRAAARSSSRRSRSAAGSSATSTRRAEPKSASIHESLALPAYSGPMLNLIPQPEFEARPQAYAEAVSRLASVRHALRLVDGGFSAGPADDGAIAGAWDQAGEARQRCFDKRSERLVGATAAGVEAL